MSFAEQQKLLHSLKPFASSSEEASVAALSKSSSTFSFVMNTSEIEDLGSSIAIVSKSRNKSSIRDGELGLAWDEEDESVCSSPEQESLECRSSATSATLSTYERSVTPSLLNFKLCPCLARLSSPLCVKSSCVDTRCASQLHFSNSRACSIASWNEVQDYMEPSISLNVQIPALSWD